MMCRVPTIQCRLTGCWLDGRLVPFTVNGLIYAGSVVMPDSARRASAGIAFPVVMMHCQCRLPTQAGGMTMSDGRSLR